MPKGFFCVQVKQGTSNSLIFLERERGGEEPGKISAFSSIESFAFEISMNLFGSLRFLDLFGFFWNLF